MSEDDIYTLYQGKFKEIYADLIVVLGTKPDQIVFEIEATFTHIAVAKTQPSVADVNIEKAYRHIQRATLDSAKMLWIEFKRRLEKYLDDDELLTFCCNFSEAEFIKTYEKAEAIAQEARKAETVNVGVNPMASIEKYYDAALEYKQCLNSIDSKKEKKFSKYRIWYNWRERIISFLIGAAASAMVSYFFFYVPNPNQQKAEASKPISTEVTIKAPPKKPTPN